MKHFLGITINEKSKEDYRAFLKWGDSETMLRYQIRGYGDTPGKAADDAYVKWCSIAARTRCWMEDPEVHAENIQRCGKNEKLAQRTLPRDRGLASRVARGSSLKRC